MSESKFVLPIFPEFDPERFNDFTIHRFCNFNTIDATVYFKHSIRIKFMENTSLVMEMLRVASEMGTAPKRN